MKIKYHLLKNSTWIIASTGFPLILGFILIPDILDKLGHVKFGILSVIWVIIGYSSIFDLGLGKAVTKITADKIAQRKKRELTEIFYTSIAITTVMAISASSIGVLLTSFLTETVLNTPTNIYLEVKDTLLILSISIPLILLSNVLRGLLEGHGNFKSSSIAKGLSSAISFIAPSLALRHNENTTLTTIVLLITISRLLLLIFYIFIIKKNKYLHSYKIQHLSVNAAIQLLKFGGWITVSYAVGPLLLYLNHFLLAHLTPLADIVYYTIPYEVITKALIIPTAIAAALLPQLSAQLLLKKNYTIEVFKKANFYLFLIMLPVTLIGIFFAESFLSFWINSNFAKNSTSVTQIMFIGIFINSFGHTLQTFLHSKNRPDITAKLHLLELLLFIIYGPYLISVYGINGAALAWLIRVLLSSTSLYLIYRHLTTVDF